MSGLAPPAKRAKPDDDVDELGSHDTYSSDGDDSTGSLNEFIDDEHSENDEYQVGGQCNVVAGGTRGMSRFMTTIANIEKKVLQSHNKRKLAKQDGGASKVPAAKAPASKAAKAPASKASKASKAAKAPAQ